MKTCFSLDSISSLSIFAACIVISGHSAFANGFKHANDNGPYVPICAQLLLEKRSVGIRRVSGDQITTIFDNGRRSVDDHYESPYRAALAAVPKGFLRNLSKFSQQERDDGFAAINKASDLDQERHSIVEKLPQVTVTPEGNLLTTLIQGDGLLITVRAHGIKGEILRVLRMKKPEWFSHVLSVGPNADVIAIAGERVMPQDPKVAHLGLVSMRSGKIILDRAEDARSKMDFVSGYNLTFSKDGQNVTVWSGRAANVEVFRIEGDTGLQKIGQWALGRLIEDHTNGIFALPLYESLIGELHFLPGRRLLAFYHKYAPLLLNPRSSDFFSHDFFEDVLVPEFVPRQADHIADEETTNFLNAVSGHQYSGFGAISPDGKYMATCHFQGGQDSANIEMIDYFDLETKKLVHTFSAGELISSMTISPNGKLLAVASTFSRVVRIYDLRGEDRFNVRLPLAIVEFPEIVDGVLSFPSNSEVIAGNMRLGVMFKAAVGSLE